MTTEQEADLKEIQTRITNRLAVKYRRGQTEHGGDLWARPALNELANEITDLNTYFITLENQLVLMHQTTQKIRELVTQLDWASALNLLDQLDSAFREQLKSK